MPETSCANETCTSLAVIVNPVPLCTGCAIETSLAIIPLALANALNHTRETESETSSETKPVTPTRLERTAITALRVTETPITRRTLAKAIRSIGGTCATDRANSLAAWARSGSDLGLTEGQPS